MVFRLPYVGCCGLYIEEGEDGEVFMGEYRRAAVDSSVNWDECRFGLPGRDGCLCLYGSTSSMVRSPSPSPLYIIALDCGFDWEEIVIEAARELMDGDP